VNLLKVGAVSLLATQLLGESNFGSPTGVTQQDKQVLHLWHITYAFAVPIGLLVLCLILWCVFRYRVRPGSTRKPAQFQYHIPLEAAYTLIPLVIVAIIFGYVYKAENKEDAVSKDPALKVNVQGFQWGWKFTYPLPGHPNQTTEEVGDVAEEPNINDTNDLPILRLPENETVQLNLVSDDVVHSFYVPEFLFQRDLIPGVHNVVDFNITKSGTWLGECTNICGVYHAYMKFKVEVMPPAQFNSWLASQKPGSVTNSGKSVTKYSNDTGGES
jgi:cytochrome c oxidase subunit 2